MNAKTYRKASEIQPGTIVIPFIGDERFDVTEVEITAWGSVKLIDGWRDREVEMSAENGVEILGHYNI